MQHEGHEETPSMPQDKNPTIDHEEMPSCPAVGFVVWPFGKAFFVFFVLPF